VVRVDDEDSGQRNSFFRVCEETRLSHSQENEHRYVGLSKMGE
jgi:hypothetical protein